MSKTPSRCTSYSRLFSIVDYFSTLPRMPTQADRASIDSIGSLLAWMLNPLINMTLMHPGGGVSNYLGRHCANTALRICLSVYLTFARPIRTKFHGVQRGLEHWRVT